MENTNAEREQDTFFDKLMEVMTPESNIENIIKIFRGLKSGKR